MRASVISGEQYPTKVAAVFDTEDRAESAIDLLVEDMPVSREQIELVRPRDRTPGRKVERDSPGIARTAARAHLVMGGIGLIAGLILAAALIFTGVDMAASSPGFALLSMGFLGVALGLLFAGMVTARPDHDRVVLAVREAAEEGRYSVVVHATGHEQQKRIRAFMKTISDRVTASI